MYEEYKARKNGDISKSSDKCLGNNNNKLENDVNDLDEFMKDNELYVKKFLFVSFSNLKKNFSLNDETNSILEELFTDLNVPHLDEEMNKLFQMIGKQL